MHQLRNWFCFLACSDYVPIHCCDTLIVIFFCIWVLASSYYETNIFKLEFGEACKWLESFQRRKKWFWNSKKNQDRIGSPSVQLETLGHYLAFLFCCCQKSLYIVTFCQECPLLLIFNICRIERKLCSCQAYISFHKPYNFIFFRLLPFFRWWTLLQSDVRQLKENYWRLYMIEYFISVIFFFYIHKYTRVMFK